MRLILFASLFCSSDADAAGGFLLNDVTAEQLSSIDEVDASEAETVVNAEAMVDAETEAATGVVTGRRRRRQAARRCRSSMSRSLQTRGILLRCCLG